MENSDPPSCLIRIHPRDNIAVLRHSLRPGATLRVGERVETFADGLGLGHKIALGPIRAHEPVYKYGVSIGLATRDIVAGEHVHLHNMRSDYLATYTLEEGRKYDSSS